MPDDPLQRIEALEQKVVRLEQQLALMDDRLLVLEHNRLFRLWGKVYRAAANVYARIGADPRYGGLSDLRTPGDYARSVNHEQHEMEAEDHRASAAQWRSHPLISVQVTEASDAERRISLQSLTDQCYPHWELCTTNAPEYLLTLHAGDRLSPHALHFYAQALEDDSPDLVYADEDRIDSDGHRTEPCV